MKILDTKNAATFRPQRQTETRLEQTFGIANSECQGTALHSTRRDHEQCTHVHYADNVHRHTHTCIDTVYTNSYVAMTTLDQAAFALPPKDGPVLVSKAVRSLVDCFRTVSEQSQNWKAPGQDGQSFRRAEGRAALKTFKQKTAVSSASMGNEQN